MGRKILKFSTKWFFAITCFGIVFSVSLYTAILHIFPFPQEAIDNIEYSKCIYDKDGNLLRAFTGKDDCWLMPVGLDEMNPNFINATISIEDKRFYSHHGIDAAAILRAITLNVSNKKVISGASTLSMQTIRILEGRKRTLFNKIIEAVHAIKLESLYSKDEILRLYFEITPYGGNIHGVKAASLRYFQKHPENLTLAECALLAGLPQAPSRLRPDLYPDRVKTRRNRVLLSMLKNGYITAGQYEDAVRMPVIAGNSPFPFNAPHFTRFVKKQCSGKENIVTTLDSDIQHFAELALKEMIRGLRDYGVTNGSIVVIENETGAIRAMVGSADFFSVEDSGQINGALSKRSPGSALKPFTYALAFDGGLYGPKMIIADVPVQYHGYMPLDYDKKYRGPVTVRRALVDSLNIPAVEVLQKAGYRKLYSFLKDSGISTLKNSPGHYGLSLTLGSADVNLLELTNAYAVLARMGVYRSYKFIETSTTEPKRVLSEGAAYLVADILSDCDRLEAIGLYRDEKTRPKVAWKTGTSYGHRDAWTVCYNPEYSIGVWLGNFSARPSKALVGIDVAAPVAMRIFDKLYAQKPAPWYNMPSSVGERYVCALSGEPVNYICPHRVKDLYIKGHSIAKKCGVHKKIGEKVFAVWPAALQSWFITHNPDYVAPPVDSVMPKKIAGLDKNKPKIISPAYGCEYFTAGIQGAEQVLPLTANASFDTDKLYWFVNGQFYNESDIGEKLFWTMAQGRHKITCADRYGRSSSITIVVR